MRFRKLGRNSFPGSVGSASTIASLTKMRDLPYLLVPGAEQQADIL